MGFKLYLNKEIQGCIITTFHTPKDPNYNFDRTFFWVLCRHVIISWLEFYNYLAKRNLYIYPGKTTKADTFRIGSIGDLDESDMKLLIEVIKEALHEMKVTLPVKY